jgi:hypothetical protein
MAKLTVITDCCFHFYFELINSETQKLKNSETQKLKNSETQILRNSKTQKLKNSKTQKLYLLLHTTVGTLEVSFAAATAETPANQCEAVK